MGNPWEVGPQQQRPKVQFLPHLLNLLDHVVRGAKQHVARVEPLVGEEVEFPAGLGKFLTRVPVVAYAPELTDPLHVADDSVTGQPFGLCHRLGHEEVTKDRYPLAESQFKAPGLGSGIPVGLEPGNERVGGRDPEHRLQIVPGCEIDRRRRIDHLPQRWVRSLKWLGDDRQSGDMPSVGIGVLRSRGAHRVREGDSRDRELEEFTLEGEELLSPAPFHDLEGLGEQSSVHLRVTHVCRRVHIDRLAGVHPSAHPDLETTGAHVVKHRKVLG